MQCIQLLYLHRVMYSIFVFKPGHVFNYCIYTAQCIWLLCLYRAIFCCCFRFYLYWALVSHMSQTNRPLLRLLVVEPATEDLFACNVVDFVEPRRGSFHAVVRRRPSLGTNSSLLEQWLTIEERHHFWEQQLFLGPHPSSLVRSHQLSDLTMSPIWYDLCLPSDVQAAKGSRKIPCHVFSYCIYTESWNHLKCVITEPLNYYRAMHNQVRKCQRNTSMLCNTICNSRYNYTTLGT
jgi:hypothetical protein